MTATQLRAPRTGGGRRPGRRDGRRGPALSPRLRRQLIAYAHILPGAICLILFLAYPIIEGARTSFTDANLLRPDRADYIGLENYRAIVTSSESINALRITLIYTFGCVAGGIGIGLVCALALNRPFRGRFLARAAVAIPWASPHVAVALIFVWMMNPQHGVTNWVLTRVGLIDSYRAWFSEPGLALPTLLVMTIWTIFPLSAIVLLAALQAVPRDLYEAAAVDGARAVSRFWHVTMPGIRPTFILLVVLSTIWALRRFEIIWLTTQGGPAGRTNTITVELYRTAFRHHDLGHAAALGMVGVALSLVVALVYLFLSRREGHTT